MSPTPPPANMEKRRRIWFARIGVPRPLQAILGKKVFIASTGEIDRHRAEAKARPMLAEWRARIDAARHASQDPLHAEIAKLTGEYQRAKGTSLDAAASLLVGDVLQFIFERMGGMTAAERRAALLEAGGDVATAIESLSTPAKAAAALDQITGRATPFLTHVPAWKAATHLKGKTKDAAIQAVVLFAKAVSQPLETLSSKHVKAWVDGLLRPANGTPKDPATVKRYLWGCNSYWSWMKGHELVPESSSPFSRQKVQGSKTKAEKEEEKRQRFEPLDVPKLWEAAEANGDNQLAALIKLAAYAGARRESLARLKAEDINRDRSTGIRYFHFQDKSGAGVRDCPIHSEVVDLVESLVNHADANGYLFHATTTTRYGNRGDAIGKRFTRLKTSLGFGAKHTFHSIRHSVIYLFRRAGCDIEIRNEIVGHESEHVGAAYGGVVDLEQKKEWLEKAIRYPHT
jgi:integrase